MKNSKLTFLFLILISLASCSKTVTSSSDLHPDFKIGKKAFEKILKEKIDFDELSYGTYLTKSGISEEKGLNLTFETSNEKLITYDSIKKYSDVVKTETKKYLLDLDNYDFLNIKFIVQKEEYVDEKIEKKAEITIKRQL